MADNNEHKYDCLLLDNQLCFPLYVCSKEIVNLYAPVLSKLDLTYTQYITMMVMWEEKKVITKHLRERLFLDSGTLTPVLNRLEEKGYITKERSTEDARDLVVSITSEGEKLRDDAVKVPEQVGSCLAGIKDPERLKRLGLLLHEMMDIFNENRKQKK
ncbi:MAG: MarR family transcriptional regulator [Lachnospiraceae bacterium]|nr:MarR family transcriptional regulator [Lachnospiraceae bacterium]